MEREKQKINEKGIIKKVAHLSSFQIDYILMKVFARIYFLKKIFLFLSTLRQGSRTGVTEVKTCSSVEFLFRKTVDDIVSDLHADGFSRGLKLSEEAMKKMQAYAESATCYAYGDVGSGFKLHNRKNFEKVLGRDILLAKYLNFQDESVFKKFRKSSLLENIAKRYLGKSAKCIATQLWWTFPANVDDAIRSKAAHFFHRDVDDWGFVKFFFYLSDVDKGGGAHVYVKRSHKPSVVSQVFREGLRINRHHDSKVVERFGTNAVTPIYGPAGTGIAADTFGFHKGESPEVGSRLILCAVYAINDYGVQDFRADLGD